MKPKERLMNMDLTEEDMDLIPKALAYCATNAGYGEFAGRAQNLYHRWGYPRDISSVERQAHGEEFVMPGDTGKHEPVDFTFTEDDKPKFVVDDHGEFSERTPLISIRGSVTKVTKCVICDAEFELNDMGTSIEGARIQFGVSSGMSDAYDICHKCFLWVPKVAVKALRRIHAEPLSLSGGTGGNMLIPSSDSWECKPGGDLSIQGGRGGNDVSKGAMVVSRDGDLTCLP